MGAPLQIRGIIVGQMEEDVSDVAVLNRLRCVADDGEVPELVIWAFSRSRQSSVVWSLGDDGDVSNKSAIVKRRVGNDGGVSVVP